MKSENEAGKLLFQYEEDKTLAEVMEYIAGTYSEHYGDQKFQIQDVFEQMDIAEEFVRGAAMKYLFRFGSSNEFFSNIHLLKYVLNLKFLVAIMFRVSSCDILHHFC
jgi:hypothetical protein